MNFAKIIHNESRSVESGAYILAGTGIFGGMLGILRDALLAAHFGATRDLDIYFATFRIPDFIYNIFIFGALSAGFMPVFSKWILAGKEKAWEFVSALMAAFFVVTGAAAVAVLIFARPLAGLLVPGFEPEAIAKVAMLLRILMIQPIILGISNVVANTLQSFRRFFAYSLAPVMYNIGIITGIVWLSKFWGITGVVWGVVLGALLHFLIQLPAFFGLEFRFSPRFRAALKGLWEMVKLMLPRSFALMINQINLIFITAIASVLSEGTLSIFNFANDLQGLPQTLLALSFATAAFPALAQLWAGQNPEDFRRLFRRTLAEIFAWLIPIALVLLAFRQPIVQFTLNYGRFDDLAHARTAAAFAVFLLGLPAQGALLLFVRTFFAMAESRIPLYSAALSAIVAIVSAYFLGRWWQAAGLAAGITIAAVFQASALFLILRARLKGIDGKPLLRVISRSTVLGGIAAVLGWLTYFASGFFLREPAMIVQLLRLVLAGIPMALTFFVGIFMFKLLELSHFEAAA